MKEIANRQFEGVFYFFNKYSYIYKKKIQIQIKPLDKMKSSNNLKWFKSQFDIKIDIVYFIN